MKLKNNSRTGQFGSTKDITNGPSKTFGTVQEEPDFVVGRPNIMRGHLDTIQEMTVLSTAVGVSNMLGLNKLASHEHIGTIKQKLSMKYTTDSRTRIPTLKSLNNVEEKIKEEESEGLVDSSLSCGTDNTPEEINSFKKMVTYAPKKENVSVQMTKLSKQKQTNMEDNNPFQQFAEYKSFPSRFPR